MIENNLLGVKINYPFQKNEFDNLLKEMLGKNSKSFIFTINPEFLVDAQSDSLFKKILNKAYFNSADGIGTVMALEYQEYLKRSNSKFKSLLFLIVNFQKEIFLLKDLLE